MEIGPHVGPLQVFKEQEHGDLEVNLQEIASLEMFFKNDIVRHRLTGLLPPLPNLGTVNFVESILFEVNASGVDFAECDFKDSLLKNSHFTDCRFESSTFATCFLADCTFHNCRFYNVGIHSSDFRRVTFSDCDLTNLLIKSSRFTDCRFVDCTTSNKLLEMSAIDNTLFQGTDIQSQTITSNFGLTAQCLQGGRIRDGRIREKFVFLQPADLQELCKRLDLSPVEKLRIEYFLTGSLMQGSQYLDEALDLGRWLKTYKNPGSFVELLDSFSDFIAHLYEKNQLLVHTILLLHHVTSRLIDVIPNVDEFRRVALSLGGTHMTLSRVVEDYLDVLSRYVDGTQETVTFLVNGPEDRAFYLEQLSEWFEGGDVQITRLVPHNSPLELELTATNSAALLSFIAVFLATRTKFELKKIQAAKAPTTRPRKRRHGDNRSSLPVSSPGPEKLFSLTAGLEDGPQRKYQIQVMSVLPGSLMATFRLEFGTRIAGRLRHLLVELLSEDDDKHDA